MNCKNYRNRLLAAFLASSSTTLFPATARAQQIAGKFTLPFAVHWGQVALPPGDYQFTAPSSSDPLILTVRGKTTAFMTMARSRTPTKANANYLQLTRIGNRPLSQPCNLPLMEPLSPTAAITANSR